MDEIIVTPYSDASIDEAGTRFNALVGRQGLDPVLSGHTFRMLSGDLDARIVTNKLTGDNAAKHVTRRSLEALNAGDGIDFLPSIFLEIGAEAAKAVGRIVVEEGVDLTGQHQPRGWVGTGFLVADDILLTNYHVINSISVANAAKVHFNYRTGHSGRVESDEVFLLKPDEMFVVSPYEGGLDYAFVGIQPPGRQFGKIPLERRLLVSRPNGRANVIQHPRGRPQEVVVQNNFVISDTGVFLHYRSDTEPGSSGSPVFDNRWKLIALHHASAGRDEEGFFRNEGVKMSAIAMDLETRRARGEGAGQVDRLLALFNGIDAGTGFFGMTGRSVAPLDSALERVVDGYTGGEQDIDLGFWNIEWFANRFQDKLDRVSATIADFNLDVWALIESSPEATEALVRHLKEGFGLTYECAHSEPDAPSGRQTTSVIWNPATVEGGKIDWPAEAQELFDLHSRNFPPGLEAVHGQIFNRFPGLFRFVPKGSGRAFHMVPLHLKAFSEGQMRRNMAAKIIAYAVSLMQEEQEGEPLDVVIGGDFNAELASRDFEPLNEHGFVPVSAHDEKGGAVTYLKGRHRSLIDHVYISPNMGRTIGPEDFFIVAAERTIPDFVSALSDHRPVMLRIPLTPPPDEGDEGLGKLYSRLSGLFPDIGEG
jgi:endonuclease/exonuclease/phosphatase family metal-dependent hydrolase